MTPEQRAEIALDRILNGVGMKYAISDQIRAAMGAERERIASILETEISAITSRKASARFVGVSPLGLLTEILADIRAEPERGK